MELVKENMKKYVCMDSSLTWSPRLLYETQFLKTSSHSWKLLFLSRISRCASAFWLIAHLRDKIRYHLAYKECVKHKSNQTQINSRINGKTLKSSCLQRDCPYILETNMRSRFFFKIFPFYSKFYYLYSFCDKVEIMEEVDSVEESIDGSNFILKGSDIHTICEHIS